jgi:hypothetical protein
MLTSVNIYSMLVFMRSTLLTTTTLSKLKVTLLLFTKLLDSANNNFTVVT